MKTRIIKVFWQCMVVIVMNIICAVGKPDESDKGCFIASINNPLNYSRDGDIVIGGILQISLMGAAVEPDFRDVPCVTECVGPSYQYLRHLLVFIYAIEEINMNDEVLPNITLGFQIYDACSSQVMALLSTFNILSEQEEPAPNFICDRKPKTAAIIGHLLSSVTNTIAEVAQLYNYPQISYGFLDILFNNEYLYPSTYRTAPNESSQIKAITQLMVHFGWTWVGIILSHDNFHASEKLRTDLERYGICVEYQVILLLSSNHESQENIFEVYTVIKRSSAKVIIAYCGVTKLMSLLQSEITAISGKVWVLSVTSNIINDYRFQKYFYALNGSILIAIGNGDIPGFKSFLYQSIWSKMPSNVFVEHFWYLVLGCPYVSEHILNNTDCLPEEKRKKHLSLDESNTFRATYAVYTAVNVVAQALHEMHVATGHWEPSEKSVDTKMRFKLNYYLKNVHLKPESGEDFFFDENGNPPEIFDILNWNIYTNGTIIKTRIGSFKSSTANLVINGSQIKWESHFKETPSSTCSETCSSGNRKAQHLGRPSCCFDCVPCSEGEITNSANMETCLKCPDDQWSNPERNLCILKAIDFLSYGEPLGATLSAFAAILFLLTAAVFFVFVKLRNTAIVRANNRNLSYILLISLMLSFLCPFLFIGRPTTGTCLVRQAAFGFNFSVAISSILGKTITVVIAFNATKPNSMFRKCLKCKISIWLVPLCSLGELLICIIWLLYSPPFVDFDTTTTPGTIVMHCNEGSIVAFYTVVAYIGALAFFSFLLAFMVRKLPDTFNDAQFITFSMLVFCSVWVTFIPTYLSSRGKHVVAVEIFSILASSAGLLFFIFAPKCYIVVLKPERNTKGQVTRYLKKIKS